MVKAVAARTALIVSVAAAHVSSCSAATYYWLNRVVVPKVPKRESKKKKKAKMSVGESFAFLAGSR
jgi:ATP/ADP translocase